MNFRDYVGRVPIPETPIQQAMPAPALAVSDGSMYKPPQFQPEEIIQYLKAYAKKYSSFWYEFDFLNIGALTSVSQTRNINFDCFFSAQYLILEAKEVESVISEFTLEIKDSAASKSFMDRPVRRALIHGTPENPFWFPDQIMYLPSDQMTVIVTDLSQATNEVHVLIGGVKYHI